MSVVDYSEFGELNAHWLNGKVNSMALSPNGDEIVTALNIGTTIWNLKTGIDRLVLTKMDVKSVAWSSDGTHIAGGLNDETIRIWDSSTGEEKVLKVQGSSGKPVRSVAFDADGTRLVSCSRGTLRIWNVETGEEMTKRQYEGSSAYAVAFSPADGNLIAGAFSDGTVRIWYLDEEEEPRLELKHDDFVGATAFSPDGIRIVSGSEKGVVTVWNAHTGALLWEKYGHKKWLLDNFCSI